MAKRKIYWDTTVFLCFLNKKEADRRAICEDILRHGQVDDVVLYTSTFTIVEVVRPKHMKGVKLTPPQISAIGRMFQWRWLRKIDLDQRVANRAVELSRDYGLAPADSIHAASAIVWNLDVLQCWDRDFSKVSSLIPIEQPQQISTQRELGNWKDPIGPAPEDF